MICQICFEPYDHSRNRPYILSCPHTFCARCLNQLNGKKCPNCNVTIRNKHVNLALLELVPQSSYDHQKNDSLKKLIEVNDLNLKLSKMREINHTDSLNKIQSIKEVISNDTNRIIDMLRKNEMKLINEAIELETKLANSFSDYVIDENVVSKINEEKASVQRNEYDELQLAELNIKTAMTKSILGNLISHMESITENYEFIFNQHLDLKDPLIGVIKTNKKVYENFLLKGNEARKKRNFHQAFELFDKAIETFPQIADAYNEKGETFCQVDDFKRAIECYNKCIEINPSKYIFYFNKAIALNDLKQYEDSIDCLLKTIELNPLFASAYQCKGVVLKNMKKYDEAMACFDKTIEINPKFYQAYYSKGDIYLKKQDYKEAFVSFSKAVELNPRSYEYLTKKGNSLMYFNEYDEAIRCFDQAIAINVNYAKAYDLKGKCLVELKDYDAAIESFSKAIKIDPLNKVFKEDREITIKHRDNFLSDPNKDVNETEVKQGCKRKRNV